MTNELNDNPATTHYQTLGISANATLAEIKAAYRRVLLSSHPDKNSLSNSPKEFDVSRVQDAYRVLSDIDARAAYDLSLSRLRLGSDSLPAFPGARPAQIVSLEEFISMESDCATDLKWSYVCRCGGTYSISEKDMIENQHLIACSQCSEVVYVGYDIIDEGE